MIQPTSSSTVAPSTTTTLTPPIGGPDYRPPPGAYNPVVTQATIRVTICVVGWTATIRPPVAYTNALKARQLRDRNMPETAAQVEEDHMVPLELGGAPSDPANLWPEPRVGIHATAARKDQTENNLRAKVCAGTLTLDAARKLILDPARWGS